MASFTGKDLLDYIYYKKMPELYRNYDEAYTDKKDLYRYMKAALEGGFDETLDLAAKMTDLVDPWKCPVEYLPYLYASWGLPYFEDIGEYYNRKFLANICEVLKRRGTYGGIKYLVRVLTGMESELRYERVISETETSRRLEVIPEFPSVMSLNEVEITSYTIQRFLQMHIPFYIRTIFFPKVAPQILETDIYNYVGLFEGRADNLFFERPRILSAYISNGIGMFSETKQELITPDRVKKLELYSQLVKSATGITDYDVTGLTGKRVPIEDWITSGSFKLKMERQLLNTIYSTLEHDLSTDIRSTFIVPQNIGKSLSSVKRYDTLAERIRRLETLRSSALNFEGYPEYDLTGLKGEKREIIEPIDKEYFFDLVNLYRTLGGDMKDYNLTGLEGEKVFEDVYGYMVPEWQDISLVHELLTAQQYTMENRLDVAERVQALRLYREHFKELLETQDYDLQLPYRKVFHIEEIIARGFSDVKDYDNTLDRVEKIGVSRGHDEDIAIRNEHDFTKLKGDKKPVPEPMETDYLFDLNRQYLNYQSPTGEYDLTGLEGEKTSTIDPAELFTEQQDLTLLHDFRQVCRTISEEYDLSKEKEYQQILVNLQNGGKVVTQLVGFDLGKQKDNVLETDRVRTVFMPSPVVDCDLTKGDVFIDLVAQKAYTNTVTGIAHSDLCGERFQKVAGNRYRLPVHFEVKRYDLINV